MGLYSTCKNCGTTRFLMTTDEYNLCSACHNYYYTYLENIKVKIDDLLKTINNPAVPNDKKLRCLRNARDEVSVLLELEEKELPCGEPKPSVFIREIEKRIQLFEGDERETIDSYGSVDTNSKRHEITRVKGFNISPRTKRLLLFTNQSPEKYLWERGESVQIGDYFFTVQTSFIKNVEPSVISSTLPVKKPLEKDYIEPLPYWPRYDAMTPEQRWIYINWLTDITKPIDIGYVFVYYYGLERHLMIGNFGDAVEEILLLQKHHHHKSFLGYSATALVVAMYARGDFKYFNELLSHEYACEHINPDILFLAKADRGIKLSAKELMVSARKIGFTNTRYIKAYPDLFEKYLDGLLLEYETKHQCDLLHKTEWQKSPKRRSSMFANLSLGDQSFQTIPCITQKAYFVKEAKVLLQGAHDLVKSEIHSQKREKTTLPINEEEIARKKAAQKEKQNTEKHIREKLINEKLIPSPEVLAYSDASKSMSKGGLLEQEGNIVGAIKQFEISTALEFFGFYPYERLMVLYHRYKMYDDEIRVIDRTIEIYMRKRFNWDISKLEARKDKALSMKNKQK